MAKHLWIAPALVLVACGGRPSSSANHPTTIEAPDPVAGGADLPPGDEAAERRLSNDGLATTGIDDTMCCYALKTETWVSDPDGAPWEFYVKTGDAEQMTNTILADGENAQCCAPAASAPVSIGAASDAGSGGCC